jgi:hypothetical protein
MMKWKRHMMFLTVAVILAAYVGAYAWFRNRHELVHCKTWAGDNNMHSVDAVLPDGRLLFIGALLASAGGTNAVNHAVFDSTLETVGRSIERRRNTLQIVFAPLRWAESLCWEMVDGKNE